MGTLTFVVRGAVAIVNSSSYRFPAPPAQTPALFRDPSCRDSLLLQKPHRRPKASESRWPRPHSLESTRRRRPILNRPSAFLLREPALSSNQMCVQFHLVGAHS